MAAKHKIAASLGEIKINDRLRLGERRGTVLYWHKDANRVTVLPDDRPRNLGTEVWELAECVKIAQLTMTCPVCGERHWVFYCPVNAPPKQLAPANPQVSDARLKPIISSRSGSLEASLDDIAVDF